MEVAMEDSMRRWNAAYDAIQDRVAEATGNGPVIYSAYSTYNDVPRDNLDEVAIEGKVIVTYPVDRFWSGDGSDYRSEVLSDPTWLELAIEASKAIEKTGDYHHVFFEGVRDVGQGIWVLVMGS